MAAKNGWLDAVKLATYYYARVCLSMPAYASGLLRPIAVPTVEQDGIAHWYDDANGCIPNRSSA